MALQVLILISAALVGGKIGLALRLPIGNVIGALVGVSLLKFSGILTLTPGQIITFVIQVLLGIMLGLTFIKVRFEKIHQIVYMLVIFLISVPLFTLLISLLISTISNLSLIELIVASAPGSMIEMATLSTTLNLEASVIVIIHFFRIVIVLLLFQFIAGRLVKAGHNGNKENLK